MSLRFPFLVVAQVAVVWALSFAVLMPPVFPYACAATTVLFIVGFSLFLVTAYYAEIGWRSRHRSKRTRPTAPWEDDPDFVAWFERQMAEQVIEERAMRRHLKRRQSP